jgi:hypothetical protein
MNSLPVCDALYSGRQAPTFFNTLLSIYRVERSSTTKYWHPTIKLKCIISENIIILTFIIKRPYPILYMPLKTNINVNYALKESQVIPDLVQTPDFESC